MQFKLLSITLTSCVWCDDAAAAGWQECGAAVQHSVRCPAGYCFHCLERVKPTACQVKAGQLNALTNTRETALLTSRWPAAAAGTQRLEVVVIQWLPDNIKSQVEKLRHHSNTHKWCLKAVRGLLR